MEKTVKTLNDYLSLPYRMEIIPDLDESGYTVSFPELSGCLSCGETMESALANADDAKREWITAALEEGIEIEEPGSLDGSARQGLLRL